MYLRRLLQQVILQSPSRIARRTSSRETVIFDLEIIGCRVGKQLTRRPGILYQVWDGITGVHVI